MNAVNTPIKNKPANTKLVIMAILFVRPYLMNTNAPITERIAKKPMTTKNRIWVTVFIKEISIVYKSD